MAIEAPPQKKKRRKAASPLNKVTMAIVTGVVVPVLCAGVGAGATIWSSEASSPHPAPIANVSPANKCQSYEAGLAQIAESDPTLAEYMIKDGSRMDVQCGLTPK